MAFTSRPGRRFTATAVITAIAALVLSACSSDGATADHSSAAPETVTTVRVGFFPNITHAPALVGIQQGLFKSALKPLGVTLTPTAFNAGPDAVTALFAGSLDISYIGPNPTINAYVESGGKAVRVISGAASGGAALVVRSDIKSVADLKGRNIATPQLGNTQDVAFRYWLSEQGLETTVEGGGDVLIKPQSNGEGLAAFSAGDVDGAWVPEPWVSEYLKVGAKVLVDEATLWEKGEFITTNIIVRTEFLEQHPDIVKAFLEGHIAAIESIQADVEAAKIAVNSSLQALTGSSLEADVIDRAFENVKFGYDPLASTLKLSATHAVSIGLLEQSGIDNAGGFNDIYDLKLLNEVLAAKGLTEVIG